LDAVDHAAVTDNETMSFQNIQPKASKQ